MKDEKDWSKATDVELIAEAKTYIGKTVICLGDGKQYPVTGFDEIRDLHCGKAVWVRTDNVGACIFFRNKWAEIVSQPNEGIKVSVKHLDEIGEKQRQQIMDAITEPKAGDMVEVSCNGWLNGWTYLGIKTSYGAFVCEQEDGTVDRFLKIRLPQKSEVESKAREMVTNWDTNDENAIGWIIEAIKWGQQNKDAK